MHLYSLDKSNFNLISRRPRLVVPTPRRLPPILAMLALRESVRASAVDTALVFHRPAAAACSRSRSRHPKLYTITRDKILVVLFIIICIFCWYPIIRHNVDANPCCLIGIVYIPGTLRIEPYYLICR